MRTLNAPLRFAAGLFVSLTLLLAGCGGGGGGSGGDPGTPPQEASPELLISAHLIPPIEAIGSDNTYVYLASEFELSRYNKATAAREVLTGNLVDPLLSASCGETGFVDFPKDMIKDGDYLYFYSSYCNRIQRLFTGVDGKSAIATVVPQADLGNCCQFNSLAGNDDLLSWVMTSGLETSYVYGKPYSSTNPATLLATVSGVARLRTVPSALYINTVNPLTDPSLYRYNITSGITETLQTNIALNQFGETATAASTSWFFWVNGDVISRLPHASSTPEVFVSGLTNITQITADDATLYALQGTLADFNTIYRIDLATKTSTPVVALDDIRDVLVYNGKLYWVSGLGLYTLNANGTTSELYVNDGSQLVIGGGGGADMVGVSGKIVVSAGLGERKLLFHDVSAGTTTVFQPIGNSFKIFSNSTAVYYGTYNTGILRIPPDIDVNARLPETLIGDQAVEKLFLDNGWLYWSDYSNFSSTYRISRMRTDGTQYQVLFNGVHRGLALYNGLLYFMCESGCSLPAWTLVSMPVDGGTIVPEYGLALGPAQMIQKNGVFYVADTPDFGSMSIFSVNLGLNDSMRLASGLPYVDITLDASPNWLYWSQGNLVRSKINGWNSLGTAQTVETSDPFNNIFVSALHTDGSNLYYWLWKTGFKRLAE